MNRPFPSKVVAIVALLSAVLFFTPAYAAAPVASPAPHQLSTFQTLSNGLRVLIVEDHLASVVETSMYYGFGAYDETPGKTGLAHALEHMMFRGTPSLNGDGLTDAMGQLGAQLNAATFPDYTRFYFVVPAEKLDLALHIEADRMQNLTLSDADWQAERGAVLTEIIGNGGSTSGHLRDAMLRAVYGSGSRYALEVGGKPGDVASASVADLRTYYEQWYAPNNATLVVTGDIKPADALAAIKKYFGPIPRKQLPARVRPVPNLALNQSVAIHGDFALGYVMVAYPYVGDVGGIETDSASLLPSIINNTRSPFYKALVEGGYVFGLTAFPDMSLHNGLLYISMTVKPPHSPAEVAAVLKKTMAQFLVDGPSAELVAAAKHEVETQNTFARDSIPGLSYLTGYVVGYEMHDDVNHDVRAISRVTAADVTTAARRYLTDPAVVGEVVPDGQGRPEPTPPPSAINDNFSARKTTGAIVQAPWVKQAVAGSLVATDHTRPVPFTLANGIRVFVQRVPLNPTVYISGSIKGSQKFDPPGKEGAGSIMAALMGYGSAKYDFGARNALQDKLSANISLGQGFSAYGLSKDFGTLVDVVADAVRHPTFPDQFFDLTKSGYLAAIARRDHSPEYRAGRAVMEILAPSDDPTLRQATTQSIQTISKADVIAYHDAFIRPDLTTITVVGDVTVAQARDVLTRAFGDWSVTGPKPDGSLSPLPIRAAKREVVLSTGTTVNVTLAQPAPRRSSADFYPFLVLNTILGSGGEMTSRLMQELRVQRGLVYGVSSDYIAYPDRGILEFHFSAVPSRVREAASLLKAEIVRARTVAPTADELSRAKKYIIGDTVISEDSLSGVASLINNIGTNDLPIDYYQTRGAIFNRVTADDVLRVAQEYLKPNNLAEVYEGPDF
ncbi:MAG: insulinase family protein [Candidatus Eremiobacteraeota bacterium]|nr:insulinase family protein [Candidatus Eremiobacteraeota bacterium]